MHGSVPSHFVVEADVSHLLAPDQTVEKPFVDAEVHPEQAVHSIPKIQQLKFRGRAQDSNCPGNGQAPPFSLTPAAHVIHDQFIRRKLLREQDGIAFPNFDVGFEEFAIRRQAGSTHLKPLWRLIDPTTYGIRSARMLQFVAHRRWNQNRVIEFGQDLNFANLNEVVDRAGNQRLRSCGARINERDRRSARPEPEALLPAPRRYPAPSPPSCKV